MAFKSLENTEQPAKSSFVSLEKDIGGNPKSREAWKIETPEELTSQGYSVPMATVLSTGHQLSSPIAKGIDMAFGGIPSYLMSRAGLKIPDTEIKAATPFGERDISKGLDTIARIIGFVRGGAAALGGAVTKAVLPEIAVGAPLATQAAMGALKGGLQYGIASAATTPEEDFFNWRKRATSGALGTAGGALFGGIGGAASYFTNLLSEGSLLKTGENIRAALDKFKTNLSQRYENAKYSFSLKYPNVKSDISNSLQNLPSLMGDNRKFRALVNAVPRLQKAIVSNGKLSLAQTQDLINQLKETISQGKLAGKSVRPSDGEILGFINEIQKAKWKAFPEMAKVDKFYGDMSEQLSAVNKLGDFGKSIKDLPALVKNVETKKALKTVLPEELYNTVVQIVSAQGKSKEILRGVEQLIKFGIVYGLINKMSRSIIDNGEDEPQSDQ